MSVIIQVLNETGDTLLEWDMNNPDDCEEKEKMFDDLRAKGYMFFKVRKSKFSSALKRGDKLDEFPLEEEAALIGGINSLFEAGTKLSLVQDLKKEEIDEKTDKLVATPPIIGG